MLNEHCKQALLISYGVRLTVEIRNSVKTGRFISRPFARLKLYVPILNCHFRFHCPTSTTITFPRIACTKATPVLPQLCITYSRCGLVAVHKFSYIAPQRHIIVEIFDNDFGICSKHASELITDICWTAIDKGTHTIHRWQAVIVMNMLWFMDTATTLDTKMTKHIVRKVQILTNTLFSGVSIFFLSTVERSFDPPIWSCG